MNYRYFGGTLEGSDFPYIHALGTTFVNNVRAATSFPAKLHQMLALQLVFQMFTS